ncbi:uncharacterized protein LOC582611 isoform X2 [Strongylocentrotus purpuratus]|uniref:Death domain-containing protein n=1 Tax=Strongylocentrotus purpuratus TaxID=7668 RepID=A0A7M7NUI4_STRPU|nr:uncharacterized protein LOC582611 isoform X2 [Strongylocentrotus purpuratus]
METDCKINLTDVQLRNLAEHIPPEKAYDLGFSLGLTKTDLSSIIQTNDPIGNTFRVLDCWRTNLDPTLVRWRNKVEGRQTELIKLKAAMKEHNLEEFISCIDAHVTIEDNEVEAASPIVNLALPNPSHQAHRRQVDVVSPEDLTSLKKNIENRHLAEDLLPVMLSQDDEEGAIQADPSNILLRLELDKESFRNGAQFFRDLDPTASCHDDRQDSTAAEADGFNVWTTRRPKPDVELADSQEKGVQLVWRNVSQQSFGF